MKTVAIAAVAGVLATSVAGSATPVQKRADVTSITVKGNAFWKGDKRFYIRGIDYQPGGASDAKDPIADEAGCKRDIAKFKELGINTVRVYTVDNTADHDTCMNALADAGIYLALDVNTPKYSINRASPQVSYNKEYLQSVFATVDKFAGYSNTLLFFSGNEVINDDATTNCAPFVKAVTRDIKSYINSRKLRKVPVGYSAADVESNRYEMADYMNCGDDSVRSDFYAFNDYSWCDPNTFTGAAWDKKVEKLGKYSLPIFLSEFGCITNKREWNEVKSIYSSDMSSVYSGGLVYEYTEEGSGYGLVKLNGNNVEEQSDFASLKAAYASAKDPSGDGGYKSSGSASSCPTESKSWNVTIKADQLPAFPKGASDYLKNGAGKGPGLTGKGSQSSGSQETTLAGEGDGAVTTGGTAGTTGSSSSTPSKGAASALRPGEFSLAPLAMGAVVLVSSLFGGLLVL